MTTKKQNAEKAKDAPKAKTVGKAHEAKVEKSAAHEKEEAIVSDEPKIVETAGSLPTEEAPKVWAESAPEVDKQVEANKTAPESNSGTIETKNVKELREVTGVKKTLTGNIYVGIKK